MRFADIAVNLTDPQFTGNYHNRQKHPSDIDSILSRAKARGVERILITGTSLEESRTSLDLAKKYDLHCTAGCHPTSTNEISKHPSGAEGYLSELSKLVQADRGEGGSRRILAIGEIGLDYDRLHFSSRETQLEHLPALLGLSKTHNLPMFLHSRAPEAHIDLVRLLKQVGWGQDWPGGVVHSFTGSMEEMKALVEMGLYIGINGCSLKKVENIQVVKAVPLNKLLLETDAPWCSITTSHASYPFIPKDTVLEKVSKPDKFVEGKGVKGRCEPVEVITIAHVIAAIKGISIEQVAQAAWDNSTRLFWPEGD
ncbi:hypothetical protein BCR39DRAFT_515713 [Naematelia encephala]|uniref:Uncharacterized protein n=1 Tax=Naematelia encephala TaxID=71784 RepID=A0A1Y2BJI8_9TREE|nr:hypothetical protein BCR39DRAFT_515713 [Naematelia encephala]